MEHEHFIKNYYDQQKRAEEMMGKFILFILLLIIIIIINKLLLFCEGFKQEKSQTEARPMMVRSSTIGTLLANHKELRKSDSIMQLIAENNLM